MTLTLTLVASPVPVSPESHQVQAGSFTIGRAADADWILPDPERLLSKRHCVIAVRDGFWEVADHSTNGTFLNDDPEPIGRGNTRDLRDGDRLRLGDYELELGIIETARPAAKPVVMPLARQPLSTEDFFPEAPSISDSLIGLVQSDHTPSVEDAFRPPRPVVLLGDDWDLDLAAPLVPTPVTMEPPPVRSLPPVLDREPVPADASDGDLLNAFLRGAGLPDTRPADPAATMESLGAVFRALVNGLRETLMARAAVKDEFRIAQTVIRASGNNPLKFSASDDDAMLALLGTGRRTDMAAADAVQEALRDIRLHELATMSAMQTAVRALLHEFAPSRLRDEAGSGGLLAQQRKARAWDAFNALHARLTQALSDDFDSTFGRAFARAYEQAQREAGE